MQPTIDEMKAWAVQSGNVLMSYFQQGPRIRYKHGKFDPVTEADTASEALLIENIRSRYPEHSILTEESGLLEGERTNTWYIDPLDGTVNYAHGLPIFSISIAYAENGRVLSGLVYDPYHQEFFTAQRGQGACLNDQPLRVSSAAELSSALLVTGFPYNNTLVQTDNLSNYGRFALITQGVRRLGSAALDLCYVAASRLDGYWEMTINPWDIAAGALIVEEAGGVVTNAHGSPDYMKRPITVVAANPALHKEMLQVLNAK